MCLHQGVRLRAGGALGGLAVARPTHAAVLQQEHLGGATGERVGGDDGAGFFDRAATEESETHVTELTGVRLWIAWGKAVDKSGLLLATGESRRPDGSPSIAGRLRTPARAAEEGWKNCDAEPPAAIEGFLAAATADSVRNRNGLGELLPARRLGEQPLSRLSTQRRAEIEPLPHVRPQLPQPLELLERLDTLGDGPQARGCRPC